MTKLEQVKEEVIKANPDGDWREFVPVGDCDECEWQNRPITLVDVLMAIEKKRKNEETMFVTQKGCWGELNGIDSGVIARGDENWKLGVSLENQNEECINFLHEILCK